MQLGATESVFRWWRGLGNPSPLLLTEQEMQTSTDCFPIEFHDMQRQHRLLHGKDVVSSLQVDTSFYRAQVEHEGNTLLLSTATLEREDGAVCARVTATNLIVTPRGAT